MRLVLLACLAFPLLTACGDKDPTDTNPPADTAPQDSDTGTEPTCTLPTVSASYALPWATATPYGGYAATATPSYAVIADPVSGAWYAVLWGTSGPIETSADLIVSSLPYSADRAWSDADWIYLADSARTTADGMVGGGYLIPVADFDRVKGAIAAEDLSGYSLTGSQDAGYAGILAVYDADGDGADDLVGATGPAGDLAELAVFSDLSALPKEIVWGDAAVTVPICPSVDRVIYGPTDAALFGDGFLAVGCPGSGYRGGIVQVFPETIGSATDPLFTAEEVSGWYVAGGQHAYLDARDKGLTVATQEGEVFDYAGDDSSWWGASPIVWTVGECSYLAVGEPGALTKSEPTGAVGIAVLGADGLPGDFVVLDLPGAPEGYDLRWIGSVLSISPDGAHLLAAGWEKGSGTGGGAVTFDLSY